jgi:hypothetical protein
VPGMPKRADGRGEAPPTPQPPPAPHTLPTCIDKKMKYCKLEYRSYCIVSRQSLANILWELYLHTSGE